MGSPLRVDLMNGLLAGVAATLALSLIVVVRDALGLMPGPDLIRVFAMIAGEIGLPETNTWGWILHAAAGLAWGLLFGYIQHRQPGRPALKGLFLGAVIWVGVIFLIMPMIGAGFAGYDLAPATAGVMLALNLAYGAILGGAYLGLEALQGETPA